MPAPGPARSLATFIVAPRNTVGIAQLESSRFRCPVLLHRFDRKARRRGWFVGGVALAILYWALPVLFANPTGGVATEGSITITANGRTLTIQQQSQRAIVNWQDFSIAAGELTKFLQPDATSAVLNRVVSGNPSTILGSLAANGRVFLINPNGILIGAGARIDAAGFLASTLDVRDDDFLRGGDLLFRGDSTAAVQNLGTINALGGDIFLIARRVENQGRLGAANGTAGLAAGSEVLLTTGGSERVFVQAASAPGALVNTGQISVTGMTRASHPAARRLARASGGAGHLTKVSRKTSHATGARIRAASQCVQYSQTAASGFGPEKECGMAVQRRFTASATIARTDAIRAASPRRGGWVRPADTR